MSHAATIDYEALSLTARITCEEALKQLCKMDTILERIKEAASNLLTENVKGYEAYLLKERKILKNAISSVIQESRLKNRDENIAKVANNLNSHVNELMTNRLMMIESIINDELIKTVNQIQQDKKDRREGIVKISQDSITKLGNIDDFVLREAVYKVLISTSSITFDESLTKAKKEIENRNNALVKQSKDELIMNLKLEMKSAGVEAEIINEVTASKIESIKDFENIKKAVSKEVIGEKVRKETIKIISKTIKNRGFIIDKKNIKIDRKKNEVKLLAQKASGEKAEFRIYLDGKFIYKFDGYEGQACQEDIQPFMTDLADIYDVKVLKQTEIWSNPDKISSMKYQTVNRNKGTN